MKNGDTVYFGRTHGEKTLGEVVKINRVTVLVKQLEARGSFKDHPIGTMWKVALNLCSPVEGGSAPVAAPAVRRPELEIMREILRTHSSLSPENLSCDGERSRSEVARWRAHYNRQLKVLFAEVGRAVSESEAFDYLERQGVLGLGFMQGRGAS